MRFWRSPYDVPLPEKSARAERQQKHRVLGIVPASCGLVGLQPCLVFESFLFVDLLVLCILPILKRNIRHSPFVHAGLRYFPLTATEGGLLRYENEASANKDAGSDAVAVYSWDEEVPGGI